MNIKILTPGSPTWNYTPQVNDPGPQLEPDEEIPA